MRFYAIWRYCRWMWPMGRIVGKISQNSISEKSSWKRRKELVKLVQVYSTRATRMLGRTELQAILGCRTRPSLRVIHIYQEQSERGRGGRRKVGRHTDWVNDRLGLKVEHFARQWWCMTLILACGRQKEISDLKVSLVLGFRKVRAPQKNLKK